MDILSTLKTKSDVPRKIDVRPVGSEYYGNGSRAMRTLNGIHRLTAFQLSPFVGN